MAKLHGVKTLDMVNGEITKVEYDGAVYEKVDGKAQAGDLVETITSWGTIKIGEKYIVSEAYHRGGHDYVRVSEFICGYQEDFKAFRKVIADQSPTPSIDAVADRGPKAGDFVKYAVAPVSYITAGKYYEITEIDGCGDLQITDDDGDNYDTCDEEFEVYEKVGAETSKAGPSQANLNVGDYAKVVNKIHEFEVDNIVKIVGDEASLFDFKVEFVNVTGKSKYTGQTHGYIDAKNLVTATDEEVASAMKEQAEAKAEARWAKIGRKPDEFKKGDIVIVKNPYGAPLKHGELVEVKYDSGTAYSVSVTDKGWSVSVEGLITPVEQRFDIAEVSA